ncbi:MAG: imidazole glycerol phosphate synthase subunit HisH [Myxococcales bacterium]|nr:imidazole glycerol phosphate synthase subunit HisH [Myxococcales bacterium]MCB9580929.1 imidazole glycerol phosphate synthase subunit HisH [Polyangiaceae bacterium]
MAVVVVDTGLGNLRSVEKALAAAASERGLSVAVVRASDPEQVRRADRIVVPGQGGFRDCARALSGGLRSALEEAIGRGTPYFGICLGLQVLFESSAEAPGEHGLGVIAGSVERLDPTGVKIPHMGWNPLELGEPAHPWLAEAGGEGTFFYFVHSFHAVPKDTSVTRASCSYGENRVTAAVCKDNVFAVQFHPEKSQRAGLTLLGAFLAST